MREKLTTGQLIDTLKDGERALSLSGFEVINDQGHFRYTDNTCNRTCKGHYFRVTPKTSTYAWRIAPMYVSFHDAMKAYEKGTKVTVHFNDGYSVALGEYSKGLRITDLETLKDYTLEEFLFEAKWTIEA